MKSDYDIVGDINYWKDIILYVSTFITFSLTIEEKFKITEIKAYAQYSDIKDVLIAINVLLAILYVVMELTANYIFTNAENNRRLQYLDNSFETNFAGKRVDGYFTQDKLKPGFYKLAVNAFENAFHTYSIARLMQPKIYIKALFVFIFFAFSAAVGEKEMARSLVEAILPLALIQDAIKLAVFVSRLKVILDNYKTFFTNLKRLSFEDQEPEVLKNVIFYETTLSWASLPLESDIFIKNQQHLAQEWEMLKKEYAIDKNYIN
ncbi:hypothetical protein [Xanthocytophaga flava]|uniref:hypothetical protein n=1 Tax=Xanthocytophaga flava TaxID=3048013 RepID=UPI0028D779DF|nr:hypothetical protein [Xanthocytophaga flavus]MDJ1473375.1 hypothetical protein [Xanthocytophaga flavus]